jgi:L-threonylcarbamoyladenylate synthase
MRTITLRADFADAVRETAAALAAGGTAVFPTETVYGLVARATAENARSINRMKRRDEARALPLLVGVRHPIIRAIWSAYRDGLPVWRMIPGPYTFVVSAEYAAPHLSESVLALGYATYGVRAPAYRPLLDLIERAGVLVSSSANVSDDAPPASFEAVSAEVAEEADACVDGGHAVFGDASAVIELPSLRLARSSPVVPATGAAPTRTPIVIAPEGAHLDESVLAGAERWLSYANGLQLHEGAPALVVDMVKAGAACAYYPYLSVREGLRLAGRSGMQGIGLIVPGAPCLPLTHLVGLLS